MTTETRRGKTEVLRARRAAERDYAVRAVVVGGACAGREALVRGGPLRVGRSRTADLRVDDPSVSAIHVELAASPFGVLVHDVASANGTLYAGAYVADAVVTTGSILTVGRSQLRVELLDAANPDPASENEYEGTSPPMKRLHALVARVAPSELAVLVEGEPGTETDLVARAIHDGSSRARHPFVTVDCRDVFDPLAAADAASEGTLVLLAIDALPIETQDELLAVLRTPAAPRVVAVAFRDLAAAVNDETFLEELYDVVAAVRVRVPPLRDRAEEIPALVYRYLQELPADVEASRAIARDALAVLKRRAWPGNARELREVVERAAQIARGPAITVEDLAFEELLGRERERGPEAAQPPSALLFKDAKRAAVDDFEQRYLEHLLTRSGGSMTRAAALAGLQRHHLRELLRKHGLAPAGRPRE